MPLHVFGHGRLTHRDSQLQKLSVNPRGTPARIRSGELPDHRAHVRRYGWAPGAVSAFPGPEQAKTTAMPRDDRLRFDVMNGRAPAAPHMREPRPKDSIGRREARTRAPRSIDDSQLVSERDDFQGAARRATGREIVTTGAAKRRRMTRLQAIGERS